MADQELTKLRETIKKLLPKMPELRKKGINEATTRASLIDPLLSALGWDVANPDDVQLQAKGKANYNPVDYALTAQGQIKLIIEAKRLGEDLGANKWVTELLANAAVAGGAVWGVLTDGDEYRIYRTDVPVDAEQKLFCIVRISRDNDPAGTLVLLSKSNMKDERQIDEAWDRQFADHRVKNALQAMLKPTDTGHKGLIALIRRKYRHELAPNTTALIEHNAAAVPV